MWGEREEEVEEGLWVSVEVYGSMSGLLSNCICSIWSMDPFAIEHSLLHTTDRTRTSRCTALVLPRKHPLSQQPSRT